MKTTTTTKTFKPKDCKDCGTEFSPLHPCHLYCSEACTARGKTTAYLKRNYGITLADYEQMLEDQEHLCAICGGEGFVMKVCHSIKLVVDHCHQSGAVRGLLCHNCNRALGLLQDDTTALQRALEYLEGATTRGNP